MRKIVGCLLIAALLTAPPARADPQTTDCANPVYRQSHLQDCNAKHDQWAHGGGGGGGLLGLGGIGGIL